MAPESGPRTLLQVTALLGVIVIGVAAWVMDKRRTRYREEADLIAEIEASSQAPDAQLIASPDWGTPRNLELDSRAQSLANALQHRILPCTEQWDAPPQYLVLYIEADGAGRLSGFAVQGAPESFQTCMLKALDEGRYPRNVKAVTELPLMFR